MVVRNDYGAQSARVGERRTAAGGLSSGCSLSVSCRARANGLGTDGKAAARRERVVWRIGSEEGAYWVACGVAVLAQSRRSEPFGRARAACFERLAGAYASRVAAYICDGVVDD